MQTRNLLTTLPFFSAFGSTELDQIGQASEIRSFAKGATILREGEANDNLFFTLSGQVSVWVEGEVVAHLENPGELLGEMSVITQKPCSATIQAETEVSCLCVNADSIKKWLSPSDNNVGHAIYHRYAMILSERLMVTNTKARRFEIANRELLGIKAELENVTQVRLEEFSRDRMSLRSRLQSLVDNQMRPLHKRWERWRGTGATTQELSEALGELEKMISWVEPLVKGIAESFASNKRVLLVESSKKNQVIAKTALGGSGVLLDIVGNVEEALAALQAKKYDLVFACPESVELADRWNVNDVASKLVVISSGDPVALLPMLQNRPQIHNIISRDDNDRVFTVRSLITAANKILGTDIFGLDKYLLSGAEIHLNSILNSNDRAPLMEKMREHFSSLGMRTNLIDRCATVCEEMMMNALYDAPADRDGKPMFNHLDRKETVVLKPHQAAEFRYACDGATAAISVTDPFGRLNMPVLLKYLQSNYSGTHQQEQGKGGAGRGLHQIIEHSDLVIFNVQRGKRTEAIALFGLDRAKEGEERPSSFQFFALD